MLNGLIAVKDCKLDELLRKGEISQASQLALTVLKTANETPDCGKGLSIEVKTSVSKIIELIKVFYLLRRMKEVSGHSLHASR